MRPSRRNTIWRPLRRRLCAAVTLLAYLLTALGIPLPAAARPKEDGASSCCQNVCGCPAEERDRHQCCCFRAAAQQSEPRKEDAKKTRSCCDAPEPEPGCNSPCCREHPPADSDEDDSEPDQDEPENEPAPAQGPRWVLGISALQCQGLSTLWVASGAALPPTPPLAWSPRLDRVAWLGISQTRSHILSSDPPAPPPRLSQA
jgi:hypothetical protein